MRRLRAHINRHEFSGAFGDIGTDLPLIVGMLLVTDLNPAVVLTVFGLTQMASALCYGIPMPVQPLKAVAALVIAGGIPAAQIHGAGLSIGLIMLALTASGLLDGMRRLIPRAVIRGLQLGLGLKLALLALGRYVPAEGAPGLLMVAICAPVMLLLMRNRRFPPALPILLGGLVYVLMFKLAPGTGAIAVQVTLPEITHLTVTDIGQGLILLALPQIPLSLGNSLFATHQLAGDLFPDKPVRLRKIGYTYSIFNVVTAFLGGIPVCHGAGGMAGHYVLGGRTGGSVFLYGAMLLTLGFLFGDGVTHVIQAFPLPLLGVILAAEAGMLVYLARDVMPRRLDITVAVATAACAVLLPYGFLIGMLAGTAIACLPRIRRHTATASGAAHPITDDDYG